MGFIPAKVAFWLQRNSMWMGINLPFQRLLLEKELFCMDWGMFILRLPRVAPGVIKQAADAYFGQPIHEYCHATEMF